MHCRKVQADGFCVTTGSDELTRDWRKLREKELHDLCCSRNITRLITSRRMMGGGFVACTGGGVVWWEN